MVASPAECHRRAFVAALRVLSTARRVLVAYSGGLDSHVLLHLLADLRGERGLDVRAVHVNHGLQDGADRWAAHCATVCADLAVPLVVVRADARPAPGESPEAAARRARYGAFARALHEGEELVTAHTSDDQAETLLLRLLRGSGVDGAAGIPAHRELGRHRVVRPLLGFTRAALREYARSADLRWIDDPSNRELRYDRNFVRHEVLPLLRERWPAATVTLARAAAHFAESAAALEASARDDLAAARAAQTDGLSVAALQRLAAPRRAMVLRSWLREAAGVVPSRAQLRQILDGLGARPDGQPRVRCGAIAVRRFRDRLLVVRDAQAPPPQPTRWSMRAPLALEHRSAPLTPEEFTRMGLRVPAQADVEVRYRRGGERIRLHGHAHRKSLKKLFQERGVPPWERDRVPLLYVNGELAAVLGIGVASAFCEPEVRDGGRGVADADQRGR